MAARVDLSWEQLIQEANKIKKLAFAQQNLDVNFKDDSVQLF